MKIYSDTVVTQRIIETDYGYFRIWPSGQVEKYNDDVGDYFLIDDYDSGYKEIHEFLAKEKQ